MKLIADVVKKLVILEYKLLQTIDVALLDVVNAKQGKDGQFSSKYCMAYMRDE